MREIKFRGKTVKGGEWIQGDLFNAGTVPSDGEFAISYWDEDEGWINEYVREDSIGQWTGIFDDNHMPVFEGDVVETEIDNMERCGRLLVMTQCPTTLKGVVRYDDKSCKFQIYFEENEQGYGNHIISCEFGWFGRRLQVIGPFIENKFKLQIDKDYEQETDKRRN